MPGPKPQYMPKFRKADLEQIDNVLRSSKAPFAHARRAYLARLLHREPGIQNMEVARHVDMHFQIVRKWRRRWTEEGFSLEDKPRFGRPRFFRAQNPHPS